jgi:hypothetical protein
VVRIKAEPAKNPSFWTKHSQIEHEYVKVGDFWLPAHNHSVSTVRFGGRADLTIDYTNYEITDARPLGAGLHAFAEHPPKIMMNRLSNPVMQLEALAKKAAKLQRKGRSAN